MKKALDAGEKMLGKKAKKQGTFALPLREGQHSEGFARRIWGGVITLIIFKKIPNPTQNIDDKVVKISPLPQGEGETH